MSSASSRFEAGRWAKHRPALLVEALLWLTIARLLVSMLPFRRVAALLGLEECPQLRPPRPENAATLEAVAWVIPAVARQLPWTSTCLVRALAGNRLLRRRDVLAPLHLGARASGDRTLLAHAWLSAGGRILLGEREAGHCRTLALFETRAATPLCCTTSSASPAPPSCSRSKTAGRQEPAQPCLSLDHCSSRLTNFRA